MHNRSDLIDEYLEIGIRKYSSNVIYKVEVRENPVNPKKPTIHREVYLMTGLKKAEGDPLIERLINQLSADYEPLELSNI